mgnify:CR=1 FL=1
MIHLLHSFMYLVVLHYITKRRLVSAIVSWGLGWGLGSHGIPTKGMTAAQLRLLRVFALEFIPDGVEQLQVTLVRPLLQGFDKRPT